LNIKKLRSKKKIRTITTIFKNDNFQKQQFSKTTIFKNNNFQKQQFSKTTIFKTTKTFILNSKVIVSESEDAETQVVLKATIYQMARGSPEGASLFINHHGADSDVHRRALLIMPPR
jgi:hypothetical protein